MSVFLSDLLCMYVKDQIRAYVGTHPVCMYRLGMAALKAFRKYESFGNNFKPRTICGMHYCALYLAIALYGSRYLYIYVEIKDQVQLHKNTNLIKCITLYALSPYHLCTLQKVVMMNVIHVIFKNY